MRGAVLGRLVAIVVVTMGFVAAPARAEVTPAEDTGAQGRNDFGSAGHVPPIKACNNIAAPSGSLVVRVLPDGPRHADRSLAFVSGVCVYLPPGYASDALRYPTLYLLHGGGADQAQWVTSGGVQKMFDDAYAADPSHAVIAVMPDGYGGEWHDFYDGSMLNEQYVLNYVVPYIDAHFRTIGSRQGRAIAGLSNGGYGALLFAAKAPDAFIAVGGMSSNVGARLMNSFGAPPFQGAPDVNELSAFYYGNTPLSLVPNLDGVNITMDLGGYCANPTDLSKDLCLPFVLEAMFRPDNEAFRNAMRTQHHVGAFEYRTTEGEHTWRWWPLWLRERQLPFIWRFLAKPQAVSVPVAPTPVPASFRYRTIALKFSVYGFDFSVSRANREFLDVSWADEKLTLSGTGVVDVTTPDGRQHVRVDLGPGHDVEQYSAQARLEEASGQYKFVTRTVDLKSGAAPVVVSEPAAVATIPATGASSTPALLGAALLVVALFVRASRRPTRSSPTSRQRLRRR